MTAPLILSFDTAAAHCAAALVRGGTVIAQAREPMARGQAERLFPMIAEMLEGAGLGWEDPDAIGVGTGPGTFTGVRIAVAAARGLALARGIPAIGVTALEAAAEGAGPCAAVASSGRGWLGLQRPGEAPVLVAEDEAEAAAGGLPLVGWVPGARRPPEPLAVVVARLAASRLGTPRPRPAPLYLRPPDAAPAREAAPPVAP